MSYRRNFGKLVAFSVLAIPNVCFAQTAVATVEASAIASGKPVWIASSGDQSTVDALVDIGTITQIGDELDVSIRWPYMPASYGPEPAEEDRVVCASDQAISFSVNEGFIGADGKYHITKTLDPLIERKKAEGYVAQWATAGAGFMSYGPDPRSLACWAVARKCAGQKFTWPPPPNNTPLENTPQALKMNDNYNKSFIPKCTLSNSTGH
jgi:hypothetical protein